MRTAELNRKNEVKNAMEFAYAMGLHEPEKKHTLRSAAMEFAVAMGLKNPLTAILDFIDGNDQNDHMRPRFAV